jgi:hypothetical protein
MSNDVTRVTDINALADVLAVHQRVSPPSGECSCGHTVPLGQRFTTHQVQMLLADKHVLPALADMNVLTREWSTVLNGRRGPERLDLPNRPLDAGERVDGRYTTSWVLARCADGCDEISPRTGERCRRIAGHDQYAPQHWGPEMGDEWVSA